MCTMESIDIIEQTKYALLKLCKDTDTEINDCKLNFYHTGVVEVTLKSSSKWFFSREEFWDWVKYENHDRIDPVNE